MDLQKIRNMSDKQLEKFLKNLSKRDCNKCSICEKECTKVIKVDNKKEAQSKQLCGICDECYEKLLDFLQTTDISWD